jgi:FAD/FMN-containing dehydrogenase
VASVGNLSLQRDLARVVGSASVLDEQHSRPYTHDASIQRGLRGTPDAVVCPDDAPAVAAVMRWCYDNGVAVVPRAGGTGLAGGAVPVDGGVVVSVERMGRVIALEPERRHMHVQAGVSTAHVARLARENGLMFAPDPGAAEQSRIGGNVATNAAGPHAFKYGATGDWVGGLQVALAPGELAELGSQTRKDASSYDLVGLMVGSEGTLGIVTSVHLHLLPAPAATAPAVVFLEDLTPGQQLLDEILGSGMQPAVLDFIDGPALALAAGGYPGNRERAATGVGVALLIELDGSAGAVTEQRSALDELVAGTGAALDEHFDGRALWRWRDGLNGVIAGIRGGKVSEDICVPADRLRDAVEGVYAIGAALDLPACAWGHAGDGIVHATFLVDPNDPDQLQRGLDGSRRSMALALALGGTITGEHGVGVAKRELLGVDWDAATRTAHARVKAAFDPRGLLNPGKKEPLGGTGAITP